MKGTDALHGVQEGEDYPSFSSRALLTRYTAASCHHGKCHGGGISPTVIAYTVPESDVYVIVYDNASSSAGHANATIHIDLATYDLTKQVPYAGCQALTCSVDTRRNECLLLQAPSEGDVVTVHITAKRRWLVLTGIAFIPMMIAFGLQILRRREGVEEETRTPPPATNPEAAVSSAPNATAPISAQPDDTVDYESIPIVTSENVIPVAVPVDAM
jgi:hypothetical protein